MPIYEYRCKDCHQLFEEWCRHIEDESVPHFCPICKSEARRLVSNTTFALKGGGWYVTEYGSRKGAPGNGATDKGMPGKGTPGNGTSGNSGSSSSGSDSSPGKEPSSTPKAESAPPTAH